MFKQILSEGCDGLVMGDRVVVTRHRDGTLAYDTLLASSQSGLECKDKSLTIQSQSKDADINEILRRFGITGQAPQHVRVPLAHDFIDIMDFQQAQNAILAAREEFNKLDAKVREQFDNDPAKFHDFAVDPENLPELRKMGLAPEAAVPVPVPEAKP